MKQSCKFAWHYFQVEDVPSESDCFSWPAARPYQQNVATYCSSSRLKYRRFIALAASLFVPCFQLAESIDHTYCTQ